MTAPVKKWAEIKASREQFNTATATEKIPYKYRDGLDLTPGSELSSFIVNQVQERVQASRKMTSKYEHEWRKMDWMKSAYMQADEYDKAVEAHDLRRPTTVTIPSAMADNETWQAYMTNVFCEASPTQRYRGVGGGDSLVRGALHERAAQRQSIHWKEPLHLNSFWGSGFTYGKGLAAVTWKKKKAMESKAAQVGELMGAMLSSMGVKGVKAGEQVRYAQERVMFEGTALEPVDIYQAFFDPHTTPNNFQESEYVGWIYRTTANALLRRENDPEEKITNAKYAKRAAKHGKGVSAWWNRNDGRGGDKGNQHIDQAMDNSEVVDVIIMFIDIIPAEWGVGEEDYPVKYEVALGCDDIVLWCDSLDLDHGMFPAIQCAPNADGETVMPVSHLASVSKIYQFKDWTLKNIQDFNNTVLNGIIFWDPSKVEEEDMLNPSQGKLVRVKASAYGEGGIERFVHQMQIQDVTAGHMDRISALDQLARNGIGTGDVVMGNMDNMPERPTKAGIQNAQSGQFSRLRRLAIIVDGQAMQDLAWQKAYNVRQFLADDMVVPMNGRYEQQLRAMYNVASDVHDLSISAFDLDGDIDVVPINAQLPGLADIDAASEMFKTLLASPEVVPMIAKQYSLDRLFAYIFRRMGFEDIDEFRVNAQAGVGSPVSLSVMPNEMLKSEIDAGNYVPVS